MDLERYLRAQEEDFSRALKEIRNGRKETHWMWYIFPQYRGLGFSSTARYYEIQSKEEGLGYISHPLLYPRLLEITRALLALEGSDAEEILGYPDNLKLKSSMPLFYLLSKEKLFLEVLEKYFGGELCKHTERELSR